MQILKSGQYLRNLFKQQKFDFNNPDVKTGLEIYRKIFKIKFDNNQIFDEEPDDVETYSLDHSDESVMIDFGHSSKDNSIFFSITRQSSLVKYTRYGKVEDSFLYGCYICFMGMLIFLKIIPYTILVTRFSLMMSTLKVS